MRRPKQARLIAFLMLTVLMSSHHSGFGDETPLQNALDQFQAYTGATLVFQRDDLPDGRYHDVMKPLSGADKVKAANICLAEAKLYPPNFLRDTGLLSVGVFSACVSKQSTSSTRPYDSQLGGYRYFGVYNGSNAIAAAYYSDGQLPLTFHHEIFHHIDSTVGGVTEQWQLSSDDAFYQAATSGLRPYPPIAVAVDDLERLRKLKIGMTLKDHVSEYAKSNSREDQAETARHFMSMLPDALVQAAEQPELPGSQRILHVLREYERSLPDGPGVDWFVDVALGRANMRPPMLPSQLLIELRRYARSGKSGYAGVENDASGARDVLRAFARLGSDRLSPEQADEVTQLAAEITAAIMLERIRPDQRRQTFDIWGREDAKGVNPTLRRDVLRFGKDAKRLALIRRSLKHSTETDVSMNRTMIGNLHLLSRYHSFIDGNWSMTKGTHSVFEEARSMIEDSLPEDATIRERINKMSLDEISALHLRDLAP